MTSDTPATDAAPTRRSSRTSSTPVQASETPVSTRAELRRARRSDTPVAGAPLAPATDAGHEAAPSVPAPLRAGLRSRARNTPLTDAESAVLSGAGLTETRLDDAAAPVPAASTVSPAAELTELKAEAPQTRRSRRAVVTPLEQTLTASDSALTASDPAPEPVTAPVTQPVLVAVADVSAAGAIAEIPAGPSPVDAAAATVSVPAETHTDVESTLSEDRPVPVSPSGQVLPSDHVFADEQVRLDERPADAYPADVFEAALRAFEATGETATVPTESSDSDHQAPTESDHVARGRRSRTGGFSARRITTASFSIGVMGIVGLLAVGMTTPVEAVAAAGGGEGPAASIVALADADADTTAEDIQAYVAPAEASTAALSREEGYSAVTMAELAVEAGVRDTSLTYVNNAASAVQYPFPVGVPISSPYGLRWGYLHAGVDFVPGGEGAEIHAIADGVVRVATEAGASYGVHVIIDHIIDGEVVSSHYAHMQYGSLQVQPGQVVKMGDVLGTVGTTGRSTGPHLHFEILLNGTTPTEPMAWMGAHNVAETVVTMPDGVLVSDQ